MKIKEVAETLERFAPLPLQESYDNAGLQIGLTAGENVSGVLLCLDVTEAVIDEAKQLGCNLIVAHHPLLFRPLQHITMQTQVERCVVKAIQKGIAIYAAHTNLDNAPGGVNHMIAEKLKLEQTRFLTPINNQEGGSGLIGNLPCTITQQEFLQLVKKTFAVDCVKFNVACSKTHIQKVALCGGAGEFLLHQAISQGADAFVTGEMSYHRYFGHENDILISVLGHYQSEQFTIELLHRILSQAHPNLHIVDTHINTNPIADLV